MKRFTLMCALLALATAAHASIITYTGTLSGNNENPVVVSNGSGVAFVTIDTIAQTMEVLVTFSGLNSGVAASHIHCCVAQGGNAGVATITPTFTGFPSGVTSGSYDHIFDLTAAIGTYNPAFVTLQGGLTQAETALINGLATNQTYLNIHTTTSPNGEIRAFLVASPEPATMLLSGLALAGLALVRRRK